MFLAHTLGTVTDRGGDSGPAPRAPHAGGGCRTRQPVRGPCPFSGRPAPYFEDTADAADAANLFAPEGPDWPAAQRSLYRRAVTSVRILPGTRQRVRTYCRVAAKAGVGKDAVPRVHRSWV